MPELPTDSTIVDVREPSLAAAIDEAERHIDEIKDAVEAVLRQRAIATEQLSTEQDR